MSALPLPGRNFPVNFGDPLYADLARRIEAAVGVPQGILDAIRTRGERSNANQVSSAGARTPYQFIPSTRRGMIRNYGVDPWSDPESSTKAAALLLKENYDRTGDWDAAVAQYHGGLDRRNWGPRTRAYVQRVGSFEGRGEEMPQRPAYPVIEIADSYNPNLLPTEVPERPTEPVPIPGSPAMSMSMPSATTPPTKKKGLLSSIGNILGKVFMPDPTTLYGAAMNNPNGIWGARGARDAYIAAREKQALDTATAQAKLKNLLTKGEYQIAGNNIVHYPPNGGEPRIITPPATKGEKERLIDAWRAEENPEVKELMERMLLGANADPVLENREQTARIRAGATTGAARIRANTPSKSKASPSDEYEYKVINGKLMRRRK